MANATPSMFAGHDVSCFYDGKRRRANREIGVPGDGNRNGKGCGAEGRGATLKPDAPEGVGE
ncbi:MAG TPA: hypothetical protein VIY66_12675 [Candidatus Acidoferrales bacterium]